MTATAKMIELVRPSKSLPLKGNKRLVLWSGCKIRKHNKYNTCPNLSVVLISIWKIIRKNELSE